MEIKILQNKDFISKAFGMSELQYGQMVYDVAQVWINLFFGHDDLMPNILNRSPRFWAWWKNQWNNRDAEFVRLTNVNMIDERLQGTCLLSALELYNEIHQTGSRSIQPNRFVIEEVGAMIIEEEAKLIKIQNNER